MFLYYTSCDGRQQSVLAAWTDYNNSSDPHQKTTLFSYESLMAVENELRKYLAIT